MKPNIGALSRALTILPLLKAEANVLSLSIKKCSTSADLCSKNEVLKPEAIGALKNTSRLFCWKQIILEGPFLNHTCYKQNESVGIVEIEFYRAKQHAKKSTGYEYTASESKLLINYSVLLIAGTFNNLSAKKYDQQNNSS